MQREENQLEEALRLAAAEPADRPEFYRILMESTVLILGEADRIPGEEIDLEEGTRIEIQNWMKPDGTQVIPFFSSIEAMRRVVEDETEYLALPARALFEITLGSILILNPRSEIGKEFIPEEIESLLTGGMNHAPQQRIIRKSTEVLIGQPSEYPMEMISSLSKLFARRRNVRAGYIAMMHDTSIDETPHLVVGIEVDGEFEGIAQEAGTVAADTSPNGEPVDLIRIDSRTRFPGNYFFEKVKPFYVRSWGATLRSIFTFGG
jgi:hypothetical protein